MATTILVEGVISSGMGFFVVVVVVVVVVYQAELHLGSWVLFSID